MDIRRLFELPILAFLALLLLLSGCTLNWRSKLDPVLLGLIEAEKRGELESFARQGVIDLIDGSARVSVLCKPEQHELAARAITKVGGKVEIVIEEYNRIQTLVPVNKLPRLASYSSILRIELPIKPTLAE